MTASARPWAAALILGRYEAFHPDEAAAASGPAGIKEPGREEEREGRGGREGAGG